MLVQSDNAVFYYDPITGILNYTFNPAKTWDYSRDKSRWIEFDKKSDKEKLRFYIRRKAEKLSAITKIPYYQIKKILVNSYNSAGIKGIDSAYKTIVLEVLKEVMKK